jgi:hypothetical protein
LFIAKAKVGLDFFMALLLCSVFGGPGLVLAVLVMTPMLCRIFVLVPGKEVLVNGSEP